MGRPSNELGKTLTVGVNPDVWAIVSDKASKFGVHVSDIVYATHPIVSRLDPSATYASVSPTTNNLHRFPDLPPVLPRRHQRNYIMRPLNEVKLSMSTSATKRNISRGQYVSYCMAIGPTLLEAAGLQPTVHIFDPIDPSTILEEQWILACFDPKKP